MSHMQSHITTSYYAKSYYNIKSKINSHNQIILKVTTSGKEGNTCNCIIKDRCSRNGECLPKCIVYQATISSNLNNYHVKAYLEICETTFKVRYANHKKSFNYETYKNETYKSYQKNIGESRN